MKILVFDIGGTSIKYGVCVNDILENVKEIQFLECVCGLHN